MSTLAIRHSLRCELIVPYASALLIRGLLPTQEQMTLYLRKALTALTLPMHQYGASERADSIFRG